MQGVRHAGAGNTGHGPVCQCPVQYALQCSPEQRLRRLLPEGDKCPPEILAGLAVVQSRRMVLLAEFGALIVHYHGNMRPLRRSSPQSLADLTLLGGSLKQVRAADDFGDALVDIIYNHRQLIGDKTFLADDYRVIKASPQGLVLSTQNA